MQLRERLGKIVADLAMNWGAEGQAEKAATAAGALVEQAVADPTVPVRLLQVLILDPNGATTPSSAPVRWVLETLRNHSDTLGGSAPVGWCRVIALAALTELIDTRTAAAALIVGALRDTLTGPVDARWSACLKELLAEGAEAWSISLPDPRREENATWESLKTLLTTAFKDSAPSLAAMQEFHTRAGATAHRLEKVVAGLDPPVRLLWMAQSAWSERLKCGWDEVINPEHRALVIIDDLVAVAPASDAATSFILRTLRTEDVALAKKRPASDWAESMAAAVAWTKDQGAPQIEIPEPLLAMTRACAVGLPATATQLGIAASLPGGKIDGRAWYLAIAREKLMTRHWNAWTKQA